jgi:hypothetical protein
VFVTANAEDMLGKIPRSDAIARLTTAEEEGEKRKEDLESGKHFESFLLN